MNDQNEHFPPESVDEQVEQLLKRQNNHRIHHLSPADERVVRDLSRLYQADARSLNDVWGQLEMYAAEKASEGQGRSEIVEERPRLRLQQERGRQMIRDGIPTPRRYKWPGLLAAALVATVLVGSMFLMFQVQLPLHTIFPDNTIVNPNQGRTPESQADVYVSGPGRIYKLDGKTGKVLWHYQLRANSNDPNNPVMVYEPILVVKGTAYGRAQGGDLYAIDANTGKERWTRSFGAMRGPYPDNDTLYMYETQKDSVGFYELKAEDGSLNKRFSLEVKGTSADAPVSGKQLNGIFYVSQIHTLSAFELESGKQLWQASVDETYIINNLLVGTNDIVYVLTIPPKDDRYKTGIFNNYIFAFDARNGKQLWQSTPITDHVLSLPALVQDVLYCASQNGLIDVFDARTGKLLHRYGVGGPVYPTPVVKDGVMYVGYATSEATGGITEGGIKAIKLEDSTLLWEKKVSGYMGKFPLIVQDDVVYANGAELQALDALNGEVFWKFKPDNTRENEELLVTVSP